MEETRAYEAEASLLYCIFRGLAREISYHFAAGFKFSCCDTSADALVYPNYITPVLSSIGSILYTGSTGFK